MSYGIGSLEPVLESIERFNRTCDETERMYRVKSSVEYACLTLVAVDEEKVAPKSEGQLATDRVVDQIAKDVFNRNQRGQIRDALGKADTRNDSKDKSNSVWGKISGNRQK